MGIGVLAPGNGSTEVGNLRDNVNNTIRPDLFLAGGSLTREVHIDTPLVRVPSYLPVEVQTAEELHADVEPKACGSNAGRTGVPATLLDQGASAGNVVHPLKCALAHDLVDIQNDGRGRTDHRIALWIL